MAYTILATGNEAVGWGAIHSSCKFFAGYPITPQNEIPEFLSRELPKVGGVFIQSEDEGAASNMVYGASIAGVRAMTSTSSPGFSLMQEAISAMAVLELPAVIVNVSRNGPGWGTTQTGQQDYRQATKGGGHGGYRCIILAPASVQETFDLMQLAFYLADKYRMVVILLTDALVGQMTEPLELGILDFGPLPEKDWALIGSAQRGGWRYLCIPVAFDLVGYCRRAAEKYQKVADSEKRYETHMTDEAQLLLVAYGSTARACKGAIDMARAEGLKLGLFRPITLWPFPNQAIKQQASQVGKVLVVEDSEGQLVEDVELAIEGQAQVHLLGIWARHQVTGSGVIHPERILQEVKTLI